MGPPYRKPPRLQAARLDGQDASDAALLQVLLEDYSEGRDDERTWITVLATLIAVAFTLVGLLAAAVTQTCRFNPSKSCTNVPDYLVGAAPLLPIALIAFTQMLGTASTFRHFYLRAIEEEIRQRLDASPAATSTIPPASYVDMTAELVSLRRGRMPYRILANLIVITVLLVFGGFAAYIGVHMDPVTQVLMTAIYAPIVLLLAYENYYAGAGGRSMFSRMARQYLIRRQAAGYTLNDVSTDSPASRQNKRSLVSYLILPRVAEWVKWAIAPGAFVVTAWATGTFHWKQFILVWLILEYLIYEARYQWNDIRGIHEDAKHPESTARLRLPDGTNARRNILASCLVGALRLGLALYIAALIHLIAAVALLIGLVFGVAIAYEGLRTAPANPHPSLRPTARSAAIWIIVGLGYAIRSGTGIWLGGLRLLTLTAISGMLYFTAFGIMFVLLTWVLEAAAYCSTDGGESLFPAPELAAKPHIAILLRWTGWSVRRGTASLPGATVRVLKEKRGKLYAPWNVALFFGAGLGAIVGTGLARSNPAAPAYGPVLAASLLGAILLMVFSGFATRLVVTAVVAVALVGITWPVVHSPLTIIAAIPWIAIAVDYAFFRESSYRDVMDFGPKLASGLATAARALLLLALRLVVGRQTWQSAGFGRRSQNPGHAPAQPPG